MIQVCDGFVEGVSRHLASLACVLFDLIKEYTIVKCKPKSDWMSGIQALLCKIVSCLVRLLGISGCRILLITGCVLGYVTVIITLHLLQEDKAFLTLALWFERILQQSKYALAYFSKFGLDILLVLFGLF